MALQNRVREAVREVQFAALRRWQQRAPERERTRLVLEIGGAGSADTPQRQAQFSTRQAGIQQCRELKRIGRLPIGIERRMGPTLDWVDLAPSEVARKAGRPVARIVDYRGPGIQPEGIATGFLIGVGLLMTNHHVFQTAVDAVGTAAQFLYERGDRGITEGRIHVLEPDRFFLSDPHLDFAIVAVRSLSEVESLSLDDLGVITMIEATPKILKGQPVNIIQHPEGQPKRYAIRENKLIDILEQDGFLHYETDTARGSSGSPAYSENWELVALHHAAIPATRDGQILTVDGRPWNREMSDDDVRWIANEGTRVSVMVQKLSSATASNPEQQALLKQLLATTIDPVPTGSMVPTVPNPSIPGLNIPSPIPTLNGGAAMNPIQFHFSGPVTINVVSATPTPVEPSAKPVIALPEKVIRFDPNYKNRKGYNPAFLDPSGSIRVPTPTVSDERADEIVTGSNGKPLVLKYHHFELVMNRPRRLQMWSAVNVDYDPAKKSKRDRKEFGSDKWIPDKRLAAELQIFDAEFYKPAGNIDRGHIVRREDNAWGSTEDEIEFANSDTFHWTNCTPQHEAFNQSAPGKNDPVYIGMKGLWGDFENYVQKSRKGNDTKMCILAGPVLAAEDPEADFGEGPIAYPLKFWKVVCVADPEEDGGDPKLKVFGFVLDQTDVVEKFGIERFDPGRFKKYQHSLKSITDLTGVVFAQSLHKADVKKA